MASASTSTTEGMSAFTYALLRALDAAEGEVSATELHERTRENLQELGFRQSPLLKAPKEPGDLASLGFVTLAPAAHGTGQGRPATRPAPGAEQRATPSAGDGSTSTNANVGKEFVMTTMQPNDEKWLGLVARVAASVVPQVIGALRRRKDFAPEVLAAAPAGAGNDDAADAEQKWVAALARVSSRPRSTRHRDSSTRSGAGARTPPSNSRRLAEWGPRTRRTRRSGWASSPACRVGRTASDRRDQDRKDFAPDTVATGPEAGNGDTADAGKWVAALARAVIPAAINARPGTHQRSPG